MPDKSKTITVKGIRPTIEGARLQFRSEAALSKTFSCPEDCDTLTVSTEDISTTLIIVIGE